MTTRTLATTCALGTAALSATFLAGTSTPAGAAYTAAEWDCATNDTAPYTATVPVSATISDVVTFVSTPDDIDGPGDGVRRIVSFKATYTAAAVTNNPGGGIAGTGHEVKVYGSASSPTGQVGEPSSVASGAYDPAGNSFTIFFQSREPEYNVAFDPAPGAVYCADSTVVQY